MERDDKPLMPWEDVCGNVSLDTQHTIEALYAIAEQVRALRLVILDMARTVHMKDDE